MATSQISVYFGKLGLSSKAPFTKRHISGCFPIGVHPDEVIIEDKALLAVLIALYPIPEMNSCVRNSVAFSNHGLSISTS